jgi:hypothetical protein
MVPLVEDPTYTQYSTQLFSLARMTCAVLVVVRFRLAAAAFAALALATLKIR